MTTVLLTTIISILAASVTGYICIRWIRSSAEQTLTQQLEINLKSVLTEKVTSIEAKLSHYEKYVELMTDSISDMYADEQGTLSRGKTVNPPVDTHEYAMTRGFASSKLTAESLWNEIRFFSNLERIWKPIAHENEDLISTMYLGTKDGLLISYDKYSYLSVPPEGQELVYNYYYSEWYKRGMIEDGILYTGVYMDSQGRGLTITLASGFDDENGERVGVTCMDFNISSLYNELFSTELENGTSMFLLDHLERIISPDSDTLELEDYTGLTLDELDELTANPNGIMVKNNLIYVCIPMERVGWTLCASVPKEAIQESINAADESIRSTVLSFVLIVLAILLIAVVAVNKSVKSITYPLELLGSDIKKISDGDFDYRASVYRNDEIGDITSGMNKMVDRLNFTLNELLSSQQHADAMSRLATIDTLTGLRNKTAFDAQSKLLTEEIAKGNAEFGFAMLDLNNLKLINDNYGHEKGDIAIKNLSVMVCDIFTDAPIYRVGGDEFVILLEDETYKNIQIFVKRFKERIHVTSTDWSIQPWERTSASIGYALYDRHVDSGTESVLARADKEMYRCKKSMKGL